MLLDAMGSEPDQAFGRLSEAMRATLTVGRPIAVADSPRLAD
jgi:hypothetical protein